MMGGAPREDGGVAAPDGRRHQSCERTEEMTRKLRILGPALLAVLALGALTASAASAESGVFTANIAAAETAEIHGEQIGTDDITINGRALTCITIKETGKAEATGPISTYVEVTPEYNTCHVIIFGFVTRTVTVLMNGCTFTYHGKKNTTFTFSANLTIKCPTGKQIEVEVLNTDEHNDEKAATLCLYTITHQTINNQIELTNDKTNNPDDILAHFNMAISTHNKIKNGTCGENDTEPAVIKGTHTFRATNALSQYVNTTVS